MSIVLTPCYDSGQFATRRSKNPSRHLLSPYPTNLDTNTFRTDAMVPRAMSHHDGRIRSSLSYARTLSLRKAAKMATQSIRSRRVLNITVCLTIDLAKRIPSLPSQSSGRSRVQVALGSSVSSSIALIIAQKLQMNGRGAYWILRSLITDWTCLNPTLTMTRHCTALSIQELHSWITCAPHDCRGNTGLEP